MSKSFKIITSILAGLLIIGTAAFGYSYYKGNMSPKVVETPVELAVITEEEKALNEMNEDAKTADDLDTTALDEQSKDLDRLDVSGIQ